MKSVGLRHLLKKATSRRNRLLAIGAVLLAITGSVILVHAQAGNHRQERPAEVKTEMSGLRPTKASPPPVPVTAPVTTEPSTTQATSNRVAPMPPVQQKQAPLNVSVQPEHIDFSLNPSSTTIIQGQGSPVLQAISTTGEPLEWAIMANGSTGIFAGLGITSNGRTATHDYTVGVSPQLSSPGTYQVNIMGYIPNGPKVIKQLTVVIVAPVTP